MTTQKILETVIDLAKQKGIEAEVYYRASQDTPIEFANNRLKSLQTKASEGIALRVIVDGRLGFASSTDLTRIDNTYDKGITIPSSELQFYQKFWQPSDNLPKWDVIITPG